MELDGRFNIFCCVVGTRVCLFMTTYFEFDLRCDTIGSSMFCGIKLLSLSANIIGRSRMSAVVKLVGGAKFVTGLGLPVVICRRVDTNFVTPKTVFNKCYLLVKFIFY